MLDKLNDFLWGNGLIYLILGVGIVLSLRTRLVQGIHLKKALQFMVQNEQGGTGEVSSFGALCTSLSATIGTGNIVGVATAVCAGGPGALFWMIAAAFLGMATKYAEGLLAVKYRQTTPDGRYLGGPFFYIEKGMGEKWRWLAKAFALFGLIAGVFGIGTVTQVNSITAAVSDFCDPKQIHTITVGSYSYTAAAVAAGILVTVLTALVIFGGAKRIARVSEFAVPFMAVLYVVFALLVLIVNAQKIPAALMCIIKGAFDPSSVLGAGTGITVKTALQKGVGRGIFSNEAGLGSAPIAAAAAKTNSPVRQGLVTMTGTFIDTVVICTMTGLAVVLTDAYRQPGLAGVQVTAYAFGRGLPFPQGVTSFVLMLCLVFFAFTSILGWNYYAERCLAYLTRRKGAVKQFRVLFMVVVFLSPFLSVEWVWTVADLCNGLMALPNLIALLALSGVVARETKAFTRRCKMEKEMARLG